MEISSLILDHVEKNVSVLKKHSAKLAETYRKCYLHSFDAFSTDENGNLNDYIVSGDIPAMWLRDSSTQVWNYIRFSSDPQLAKLIRDVLKRQFDYIKIDPYANAFNEEANDRGHIEDSPRKSPWVWERKYEIDSLAYPIRLLYGYWKETGDDAFVNEYFPEVMKTILNIWQTEQYHFERSEYRFWRESDRYNDTLHNGGMGEPVSYTGMTWQGFRPSDDAGTYGYSIPSNFFAYTVLGYAHEMLADKCPDLVKDIDVLRGQIHDGIFKHGIVDNEKYGKIFAYETDGMGHYELMDDANIPNLLSLPYIGYDNPDIEEIYKNTRRFILSSDNPYYYEGKFAKGLGSPHEYTGYIWHMGLSMQGITSEDPEEMRRLLETLIASDADTGYMHECFDPDDPYKFKREFFTWSDSLFCEFVEKCIDKEII